MRIPPRCAVFLILLPLEMAALGAIAQSTSPTSRASESASNVTSDPELRLSLAEQHLKSAREACMRQLRKTRGYKDRRLELDAKDRLLGEAYESGDPERIRAAGVSQERSMRILAEFAWQALATDPAVVKAEAELKRAQAVFKASTQPSKAVPSTGPAAEKSTGFGLISA